MVTAALMLLCGIASAADIYVTPAGNDTNAGSAEAPLATLHAAQLKARSLAGKEAVTMHVAVESESEEHDFPGKKVDFHGFDRFTFDLDGDRVSVVRPKRAAPGKPWLWRSMFWGQIKGATSRFTRMDLELIKQGYHVVIRPGDVSGHARGNVAIDKAYEYLTRQHGFATKVAMGSMSRETLALFRWASANPEKVESIYVDNGVCNVKSWPAGRSVSGTDSKAEGNWKSWTRLKMAYGFNSDEEAVAAKVSPIDWLEPLAKARVPILLASGTQDHAVPLEENAAVLKERYEKLGGSAEVIVEDKGHHPHGLADSAPVIRFIKKHTAASRSRFRQQPKTPNIIIVMTDDQGYGDLGCHGNPILKTPNLDQLASESVRFTDFHVSPFCTPTRAALMTGNHPGYTGAFRTSSGRTMMHRDEKTIANLFADNGYATGMVGKWHLGDNAPHRPQDRGFQAAVWHRCGGVGQASDYWGNDYFNDTYERVTPGSQQGKFEKFDGYCTNVWFREGLRFIEKNKDRPFLLYLPTNAPHGPYHVPEKWAKPYQGNKNVANANFYGMIANIDDNMGVLRTRLNEWGLTDNTILIFMTDNGTSAGAKFEGLDSEPVKGYNAGMRGKKSSVYDGGHRVPFFIHWPNGKLADGKDIDTIAAHIDVLPTLADLCGLAVPEEYDVDGVSLKPLLDGTGSLQRDHHVIQYHGGPWGKKLPPEPFNFSVVMTERWRLVNSGSQHLFDIEADPAQRKSIADENTAVVTDLRERYQPFWDRVSPRLTRVRIDLGNPTDNPTTLCSQDWNMSKGNPPWNFNAIKKLPRVNGPWMVEVKQAGRYRITLRQFPKEANKLVAGERAVLKIAGQTLKKEVAKNSKGVVFELDLPAGPTELLTYLYDESGKAGGAYFTEVEAL